MTAVHGFNSITITTGIFPPDIGGPASFVPMLANYLSSRSIKVTVVTLTNNKQDEINLPYRVVRISRKIIKPFRDVLVIKEIVKAANESDLIFSNTLAFESAIASIISGKKLVQKVVGDIAWERASLNGRFKGTLDEYQKVNLGMRLKLTNIYRDFSIKNSLLIITPSYYLSTIVSGWIGTSASIKVIYNAVEFKESSEHIKKHIYRIVSVSRLIPHKGVQGVLKALSKLDFEFEFIVIGDGPLRIFLQELSVRLNVNVKFTGNISKKDVANWLNSSDLFVLNSSYEGLPHIVLEAMENGCPVLASQSGGTPEVVKHNYNGVLFEYDNVEEMIEKIGLIKNNNAFRSRLINNGKNFTRKFSNIEKMMDQYIDVFEELV